MAVITKTKKTFPSGVSFLFELTGTEHCQQTIVAKFIDRMVNTRVNFYESVYAGNC